MGEGSHRVLVADDDVAYADVTAALLRRAGHEVDVAQSGAEALRAARARPPDLMVLDYELGDMDALEVLAELRGASERLPFPVLILTGARLSSADQVIGLERGATDYIVKGVDRQVFLARVQRAIREHRSVIGVMRRGELRIDLREGRAWVHDRPLQLERKPLSVLYELASSEGSVVTREELLHRVWGTDFSGFEHSVDQAVYAIRKQLGESWVETVHGVGYRFVSRG